MFACLLAIGSMSIASLTCVCAGPITRTDVSCSSQAVPSTRHCPHHAAPTDQTDPAQRRRPHDSDHEHDPACQHCRPSIVVERLAGLKQGALECAGWIAPVARSMAPVPLLASDVMFAEHDPPLLISTLLRLHCALNL